MSVGSVLPRELEAALGAARRPWVLDRHQEVGRDLSALTAPSLRSSDTRHISWGDNGAGRPLGWEAGLLSMQKSIAEGSGEWKQQSRLGKCSCASTPRLRGGALIRTA